MRGALHARNGTSRNGLVWFWKMATLPISPWPWPTWTRTTRSRKAPITVARSWCYPSTGSRSTRITATPQAARALRPGALAGRAKGAGPAEAEPLRPREAPVDAAEPAERQAPLRVAAGLRSVPGATPAVAGTRVAVEQAARAAALGGARFRVPAD